MNKKKIFLIIKGALTKIKVTRKKDLDQDIKEINIFSNEQIDSLKLVNLISFFEKKFKINFSDTFFIKKKNQKITKICDYIFSKIK
jgi:acyl carrier protein|tara:strand:+ start:1516 stop:1773 length:258 start_codon:yes stop_codon:yes gene_type:complete